MLNKKFACFNGHLSTETAKMKINCPWLSGSNYSDVPRIKVHFLNKSSNEFLLYNCRSMKHDYLVQGP